MSEGPRLQTFTNVTS